jgi:cell division protein FtsN
VREKYHITGEVYMDFSDGWYRFTTGSFKTEAEAAALKEQLQGRGFKDAFIARYKTGVRVPAYEK